MGLFDNKKVPGAQTGGTQAPLATSLETDELKFIQANLIKWEPGTAEEGAGLIVHKYGAEDFPNGSQLIVGSGQVAVFINYNNAASSVDGMSDADAQVEVFRQNTKIKLELSEPRFRLFRKIKNNLMLQGETAFHSLVYFINTVRMTDLAWGTAASFGVWDPIEDMDVNIRANGLFAAHIEQDDETHIQQNALTFIRNVVGTKDNMSRAELINFLRIKIQGYVPDTLGKEMDVKQVSVLRVASHYSELSDIIRERLTENFQSEYGITLDDFQFHSITAIEEDLKALKEMARKRREVTSEAEALAKKRELEGYTYQQERSFDVMGAAANNEGMGAPLMGAGMGLGMGLGMAPAMSQGMGGIVQNAFGSANLTATPNSPNTPNQGAAPVAQGAAPAAQGQTACKNCGKSMPAGMKFCPECGAKVETAVVCKACNAQVPAGSKFCPECGQPIARKCPGCGVEITGNFKFCPECGKTL